MNSCSQQYLSVGTKELNKVSNHPVHIHGLDGQLSPTALIPFCTFGGNMSIMGIKINQFSVPVCNSFRPKIMRDQLCYTVDPNEYRKYLNAKDELSLSLYVNYNEDRQIHSDNSSSSSEERFIIIETIGKYMLLKFK